MAKNKPTLTHTEILSYAIQAVHEHYQKSEVQAKAAEEGGDTKLAEMIRTSFPWKEKLSILCDLYRIETGSDYGIDFG